MKNLTKGFLIILLLFCVTAHASLTYDQANYRKHLRVALSARGNDPIYNFIGEVDALLPDTTGTGTIYYVDSGVTTEGAGTSWTSAKDTLQEGIDLCSANAGDFVYVAQGHAEDITAASALDADEAGITIVGFGSGADQPEISFITNAGAELTISAADVTIYNMRFLGAYAGGVTAGIVIADAADGARIINCDFWETDNTMEHLIMISVATNADYLVIANNRFIGTDSSDPTSAITFAGGSDKTVIQNNMFIGTWSGPVIDHTAALSVGIMILDNEMINFDSSGKTIQLDSSATGAIAGNRCYGNGSSFEIVGDAMFVSSDNVVMQTENVEGRNIESMMGAFTGPADGAAVDDNIKAATDHIGSDTDAIIADFTAYLLDKLVSAADGGTQVYPDSVVTHSILAFLMDSAANPATANYDNTAHSLKAIGTDTDAIISDTASIIASIVAMSDTGYVGTNTAASSTTPVVALLAGFGDDYFNTGWSMIITLNEDSVGNAPEGDIRDITDYVSLDGTFTILTTSAALASGDQVMVKRTEELELDVPTTLGAAGTVRYVDSGASAGDSTGLTWENAYDTIILAEAASSAGDIIYVADGHNEGWVHTTQPIIDVANLTIIGLGTGDARPLFDFDGTTSLVLTINAAGITLDNLRFNPSATDMVSGIHFESGAIGCTMRNCSFVDGQSSGDEWLDAILVDQAAAGLTIENCTFENVNATAGSGDTFVNLEDTPVENVSIIGCTIFGDFADAPIFWGAGIPVNLLVKDNIVSNLNTGEFCIEGSGAATGVCSGNRMYTDDFTKVLDPGSMMCYENYVSTAINTTAYLIPADDDELAKYGTGRIIYVDSGATAGDGRSWATAVNSLLAGEALCSDDRGDTIYVAAGHAEGTLTTEYCDIDIGGLTVIGLGNGDLRPTFTYTGASGTLSIDNDDITIKNLHFISGVDKATIAITVKTGSENVRIEDCLFTVTTAGTHEFYHCIDHAAANHNAVIKNCRFQMGGAEAVAIVHFEDADYSEIVGNEVHGAYSTACIHSDTTAADHIVIKHNVLFNGTIGGIAGLNTEPAIELLSSTTGVITDNTIVCDESTPEASIVAADMFLARNTYSEIEGTAGSRLIGDDQSIDVDIAALVGKGTGTVWYCDSSGSNEDGRSWASAFTTINAAEDAATAGAGDIILVAEGHNENLTGADAVDLEKAGLSVIGMGVGNARPRLDFDDAASEMVIAAVNITVKNIQFRPGLTAVLAAIDIEAGGLNATIEDCAFLDGEETTVDEFLDCIIVHSTAVGVTVRGCTYKSLNVTDGHVTTFVNLEQGACVDTTIEDNIVYGDFSEAPIWGAAQVCLNLNIHNNIITNVNTGEHCIEFSGAATGMLTNNLMYADTRGAVLDPGSMYCFGNKQVIAINEGAEDVPLIAGKSYARVKTAGDVGATDQLFLVTGSPIMVTSFVGYATVAIGGAATLNIQVDATEAGHDYDLSTDVDIQSVDVGGMIVFSNAILEGVTTPAPKGATGTAAQGLNWLVLPGEIESDAAGDTGDITWYMVFTPLGPGCEVVPQ